MDGNDGFAFLFVPHVCEDWINALTMEMHFPFILVLFYLVMAPRTAALAFATRVKDTARTKNLEVKLPPSSSASRIFSLDEMEERLREVSEDMGMYISHTTVLGRKRYPGNRHWHFKQHPKEPGCLDVTYWPQGALMWISVRNYEPSWVHEVGVELQDRLEKELAEEQ